MSESKGVMLKLYFDESESHPHMSGGLKVSDFKVSKR